MMLLQPSISHKDKENKDNMTCLTRQNRKPALKSCCADTPIDSHGKNKACIEIPGSTFSFAIDSYCAFILRF